MTLSELLGLSIAGVDSGTCYLCGHVTESGHRQAPSDAFTAWASCCAGDAICALCMGALRDRTLRANSWLATQGQRIHLGKETRDQLWELLQAPPEPPFAWYLTRGRQRHGYVSAMGYVSESRDRFWVMTDWSDRPSLVSAGDIRSLAPLLGELRTHGVSKSCLLSGEYHSGVWSKAMAGGWTALVEQAMALAGSPAWEAAVFVAP